MSCKTCPYAAVCLAAPEGWKSVFQLTFNRATKELRERKLNKVYESPLRFNEFEHDLERAQFRWKHSLPLCCEHRDREVVVTMLEEWNINDISFQLEFP